MSRPAALRPRICSDAEIRDIAEHLSDRCGFGSHRDASLIIQRIIGLALDGERATSIMRRLNPPAIIDAADADYPEPDRTPIEPIDRTLTQIYQAATIQSQQRLLCTACHTYWNRKRRSGRPPQICPDCKKKRIEEQA